MNDKESAVMGMREDLGSHRLEDLPLTTSNRRGEPTFQVRGRTKVIMTEDIQKLSNTWNAAIANGEFDDDDAQGVKNLDDLGGPRPWAPGQRPYNQTVQQARKSHPRTPIPSGTNFRTSTGSSMPTPAPTPQAHKPPAAATQVPKAPITTGALRPSKPVLGLAASRWAPQNTKGAATAVEDCWKAADKIEAAKLTQDLKTTAPAMPTDTKPLNNGTTAQPQVSGNATNAGPSKAVVSDGTLEQEMAKTDGLELGKAPAHSTTAAPASTADKDTQIYPQDTKNMIDDPVRGAAIMCDWVRKPCVIFITAHNDGDLTMININVEGDQPRSYNPLDLMEICKNDCICFLAFRTQLNKIVSYCLEFEDVKQCEAIHRRIVNIHKATLTALTEDIATEKANPVASSLVFNDDAPTRAETPPMPSTDPSEAGDVTGNPESQSKIPADVNGDDKKPVLPQQLEKKPEGEKSNNDLLKGESEKAQIDKVQSDKGQGEKAKRVTYTAEELEEMRPLAVEPETPVNKVIMSYMDPKDGNKVVLVPRAVKAGNTATQVKVSPSPVEAKPARTDDETVNSGGQIIQHDREPADDTAKFDDDDEEAQYPQSDPKVTKEVVGKAVAKHLDWLFADPSSRL